MATASILNLGVQIGLTGNEWLELANMSVHGSQATSRRVTAAQIAALSKNITPVGPNGVATDSPASGTHNNYTVNGEFNATIGFVDLNPSGNCNFTGLQAGFDGQIAIITNLSAFTLILNSLNAGSLAANQFRIFGDLTLTQNDGKAFKYSATIGKWVGM